MYDYIKNKEFLRKLKTTCGDIVNRLTNSINNDGKMKVSFSLVGSGERNLITQNENEPVDLDYNLWVEDVYEFEITDGGKIKQYVKKMFDKTLEKCKLSNCGVQDSKSALTTGLMRLKGYDKTQFSIDLAITISRNGSWHRLIHKKTGIVDNDEWYWNEAPNSKGLNHKINQIKKNHKWNGVRTAYLEKKNMYLKRNDHSQPSFICYIEAVNEVYNKHFE